MGSAALTAIRSTNINLQALSVTVLDMSAVLVVVRLHCAELIQRKLFRGHVRTLGRICKHNLRPEPVKRYRYKTVLADRRAHCTIKSVPTVWVSGGLASEVTRMSGRGLILSISYDIRTIGQRSRAFQTIGKRACDFWTLGQRVYEIGA